MPNNTLNVNRKILPLSNTKWANILRTTLMGGYSSECAAANAVQRFPTEHVDAVSVEANDDLNQRV
jgi:hypothetical protein